MGYNIKNLKPKAHSRTKQGYLDPRTCKKLFPGIQNQPIEYRSKWEKIYAHHLESNPDVKYWGSECIEIPYQLLTDGSQHRYFPDFMVEKQDGTKIIVEIKPKAQCCKPATKNHWLWNEYVKNVSKWTAAKQFCESRGYKFMVLTEKTIMSL